MSNKIKKCCNNKKFIAIKYNLSIIFQDSSLSDNDYK